MAVITARPPLAVSLRGRSAHGIWQGMRGSFLRLPYGFAIALAITV
jgi:hypothetical protein